jgi:hypothetical protein
MVKADRPRGSHLESSVQQLIVEAAGNTAGTVVGVQLDAEEMDTKGGEEAADADAEVEEDVEEGEEEEGEEGKEKEVEDGSGGEKDAKDAKGEEGGVDDEEREGSDAEKQKAAGVDVGGSNKEDGPNNDPYVASH